MKISQIILAIIFTAFLGGCLDGGDGDNPVGPGDNDPNIMIFENDYYREYEEIIYNQTPENKYRFEQFIVSDTIINSYKWHILNTGEIVTSKSDGFYQIINNIPTLLYMYPASKDDRYMVFKFNFTVAAVGELVSTPAGDFKCVRYESIIGEGSQLNKMYYWYNHEVGKIKSQRMDISDEMNPVLINQLELISIKRK